MAGSWDKKTLLITVLFIMYGKGEYRGGGVMT